jgi:hypothetical protein
MRSSHKRSAADEPPCGDGDDPSVVLSDLAATMSHMLRVLAMRDLPEETRSQIRAAIVDSLEVADRLESTHSF